MSRHYLVTGGTGFIGSYLVRRLVKDGHRVCVVDNDLRGRHHRLLEIAGEFELMSCDVRDTTAMINAARGVDSIIHLAALNGTENFYTRPELVLDVGIRGLYATLDAARANGVEEFILASSSEAYQTPAVVPTPENAPLTIPDPWNPRYSYGGSKLISEIIVANYLRDVFKKLIVFRPHNVYGPDMGDEHVIPQLTARAAKQCARYASGEVPFPIQGDGSQTRSFIYIDDFIDCLMLVISNGAHRETYHVGTEDEVSIACLAEMIFAEIGRKAYLLPSDLPAGGTLRRCPEISRIRALGFAPLVLLEDGIRRTVEWYLRAAAPDMPRDRPRALAG